MNAILTAFTSALTAMAAESAFHRISTKRGPSLIEKAQITVLKTAYFLAKWTACAAFSFAGFLLFFVEALRQIDEAGGIFANARLLGFLALFLLPPVLASVPHVARRIRSKREAEVFESGIAERLDGAIYDKNSLPPLELHPPSGLDILLQELREEREDFAARWRARHRGGGEYLH